MDNTPHERNTHGHETIETDVRPVWRTAAVICGVVIACCVLIFGLMKWFTAMEGRPPANYAAGPDVNWGKQRPLQQLRWQEYELLSEYEWVDPAAGVARIPVERAIEIISQRGLPTSLSGAAASDAPSTQRAAPDNTSAPAEANEP